LPRTTPPPAEVVATPDRLRELVSSLRKAGVFALDTEFERERTYWPKLQLLQVATESDCAVVDPLALEDLTPLLDVVLDPAVVKVTHAGRQDAEIFYHLTGKAPGSVYDTQVAAALVGRGDQVSYSGLVQQFLKVRIKKTERITDWGRRPLSDAQIAYAADDVRYLLEVKRRLDEELSERGRTAWLEEELAFYNDPATFDPDPEKLWLRVSGRRRLDRRGLGILRELAAWREEEATRRDVPRNRVVPDDVLVDLAARQPAREPDLRVLRRLHPREIERNGANILAAVQRGVDLPPEELPDPPKAVRDDPETALLVDLMAVLVRRCARAERVAGGVFGNQDALSQAVRWLAGPREDPAPLILRGWRGEIVGASLRDFFDGKLTLGVDPASREVTAVPRREGC